MNKYTTFNEYIDNKPNKKYYTWNSETKKKHYYDASPEKRKKSYERWTKRQEENVDMSNISSIEDLRNRMSQVLRYNPTDEQTELFKNVYEVKEKRKIEYEYVAEKEYIVISENLRQEKRTSKKGKVYYSYRDLKTGRYTKKE